MKGDRGWEKGERDGIMERSGRKEKEGGRKVGGNEGDRRSSKTGGEGGKSREREREKGEEEWEKTTPCPPPHRFRDRFCLFGITNAHHTPVI